MDMKLIVVATDGLDQQAQGLLKAENGIELIVKDSTSSDELITVLQNADFVLIRSATKLREVELSRLPNLKGILRAGVGIDNIDLKAAENLGIWVWNAPTGNFQATAELALGLIFALARKIPLASEAGRKGQWAKKEISQGARQLQGSFLGIYGMGNIGSRLARMAAGIGMDVVVHDPYLSKENSSYKQLEWDDFLSRSDFISIHTPKTAETENKFSDAAFEKMQKGSFLVNAARGGIVDEAALLRALDKGHIGGAALDVFKTEPFDIQDPVTAKLLLHPRFLCTPHVGASTLESQRLVGLESAEKIIAFYRAILDQDQWAPRPLNKPAKPRAAVKTL